MADLATAARNVFKLCLNPTSGMGGGGLEEDGYWVLLGKWRTDWKGFTLYICLWILFGEFTTGSSKRLQSLMSMKGQKGQQSLFRNATLFNLKLQRIQWDGMNI